MITSAHFARKNGFLKANFYALLVSQGVMECKQAKHTACALIWHKAKFKSLRRKYRILPIP